MKYQDNSTAHTINGYYVGIQVGTKMQDAIDDDATGYEAFSTAEHNGTVLQDSDANAVNPTEVEEDD